MKRKTPAVLSARVLHPRINTCTIVSYLMSPGGGWNVVLSEEHLKIGIEGERMVSHNRPQPPLKTLLATLDELVVVRTDFY